MSTPAILRHRRDTAANWTSNNPVLEAGQIGYETDTLRFKFGNGSTAWNSLAYGVGALADGDVTYPKIQDTTAGSVLLGRGSSGAGEVQEISLGSGLVMTGTSLSATGGGGGAPSTADYLVKTADAGLSAERVVTDSTSITANWSTAGQVAFQRAALTGDVTATANSNATTIANGVVSTAKLGGDITTAGKALLDDADAAAQRTTLGLGTLATQSGTFSGTSSGTNTGDQTITLTGDVTGSGTGSFAATIASGAVSTSKLGGDITTAGKALLDDADASAQRTTLGLGTLATQSGTFSGTSSGTNTGDQTITLTGDVTGSGTGSFAATIANDAVTYAKMQNISATSRVLGRKAAGAGDTEECTLSEVLDFVGSAAQGDLLYRGASTWTRLAAGTSGHYLKTLGTGANPEWAAVSASGGGSTNVWIPASAWIPRTTTGCGVDSTETTTNRQNFDQLLFDAATDEFAQALVVMPSNYNAGTVTARFYWTASSGSGAVVWGLQGLAYSDDDALDTATGTAQTVTDTLLAANDMMISGATSAVTIGGTPGANKAVQFQIYRDADAGGDTLAVDARLLGVEISYTSS